MTEMVVPSTFSSHRQPILQIMAWVRLKVLPQTADML